MIDLAREEVITLKEAATRLPRKGGKKIHISTIYRWASPGLRGVKLETIRVGGSLFTSMEALQRFFERLDAGGNGEVAVEERSQTHRERTEDILRKGGF